MKEITSLTVAGESYAITDPGKLPQPEAPQPGQLLAVEEVKNGKVTKVGTVAREFDSTYVVEFDYEGIRNVDEIVRRYEAGHRILMRKADEASEHIWLPLVSVQHDNDGNISEFWFETLCGLYPNVNYGYSIVVYRDGSVLGNFVDIGNGDALGDISDALDHIIALQEELIGG